MRALGEAGRAYFSVKARKRNARTYVFFTFLYSFMKVLFKVSAVLRLSFFFHRSFCAGCSPIPEGTFLPVYRGTRINTRNIIQHSLRTINCHQYHTHRSARKKYKPLHKGFRSSSVKLPPTSSQRLHFLLFSLRAYLRTVSIISLLRRLQLM